MICLCLILQCLLKASGVPHVRLDCLVARLSALGVIAMPTCGLEEPAQLLAISGGGT